MSRIIREIETQQWLVEGPASAAWILAITAISLQLWRLNLQLGYVQQYKLRCNSNTEFEWIAGEGKLVQFERIC